MRESEILKTTTNRSVYNKLYKKNLEQRGKIRCSWCGYHAGDNSTKKWYGSTGFWTNKPERMRYPSWKLVTKNKKQWMPKKIQYEEKTIRWNGKPYIEIYFK